nr:hypothetical protein GCM10020092_029720 [Actinoplanes digitatis]
MLARGAAAEADLASRHVVVTAGGTREPLDPVRFLGNRSSGRQGYALARSAVARGARVTLIAANVTLPDPAGADVVRARHDGGVAQGYCGGCGRRGRRGHGRGPGRLPAGDGGRQEDQKKSDGGTVPTIELVTNPDIAAELGAAKRAGQLLVAFAAETHDVLENARGKLVKKRADLIVVNEVGVDLVFGADHNTVTILGADGTTTALGELPKDDVADAIWDQVVSRLDPQVGDAGTV